MIKNDKNDGNHTSLICNHFELLQLPRNNTHVCQYNHDLEDTCIRSKPKKIKKYENFHWYSLHSVKL